MAGEIQRDQLETNAGVLAMSIPVSDFLQDTGIPIVPAETAGCFNLSLAANVLSIQGEICDNETEVSVGEFQFSLPPEYVDGAAISIRFPAALIKTAAAVNNGSAVTVTAYVQASGAVGGNIVASGSPFTFAADDTWYDKDVVLTPTSRAAGDVINVVVSASIIDSEAGGGTLRLNMDVPQILMSIRG